MHPGQQLIDFIQSEKPFLFCSQSAMHSNTVQGTLHLVMGTGTKGTDQMLLPSPSRYCL